MTGKKTDTELAPLSVHNAIRDMIVNREILPGEKINQVVMASQMNVSRTPIINALHRLESEGLVDRLKNSGFYVHRLSIKELLELFELREALDIVIIHDLIRNATDEEIAALKDLFSDFKGSLNNIDMEMYRRRDMTFHSNMFKLCRNSMVHKINENLQVLSRSYTAGLIRPLEETLEEHNAVIAALECRDEVAAEREMRLHISKTKNMIQETVAGLVRVGLNPTAIHVDEISIQESFSPNPT